MLGGMADWTKGLTVVDRTGTVKWFFAGKDERGDSSRRLLSTKSQSQRD
jgi:hypothetical protein